MTVTNIRNHFINVGKYILLYFYAYLGYLKRILCVEHTLRLLWSDRHLDLHIVVRKQRWSSSHNCYKHEILVRYDSELKKY